MKISLAGVVHIGDLEDLEVLRECFVGDPDGHADPLTCAVRTLSVHDQRASLMLLGLLAHEASAYPDGVDLAWLAERALRVRVQLGATAAPLSRLLEALVMRELARHPSLGPAEA